MLNNDRNQQIVSLYKTGEHSLKSIGDKFEISHERVRQICLWGGLNREQVKKFLRQRTIERRIKKWGSLENYDKEQLRRAEVRFKRTHSQDKWHWKYDACLGCGRTDKPHKVKGRCSTCYQRYLYNTSPERRTNHRIYVKKWYDNHRERYRSYSKVYHHEYYVKNLKKIRARAKIYYFKPEVIARRRAYAKIYYSQPHVIAKRKAYYQQPEVKARIKARDRARYQKLNYNTMNEEKTIRNYQLILLYKTGNYTYQQLADKFQITPARAREIWVRHGEGKPMAENKKQNRKDYYSKPEVKARRRAYAAEYRKRPEVKARTKGYYEKYYGNPEVRARIAKNGKLKRDLKKQQIYDERAREVQSNQSSFGSITQKIREGLGIGTGQGN